ncbi:MAG TPA: HAMP domain-containing sensor histidine kinase [Cyclobacteriaceae bacterium]|nr:HAMP domain-containing sensor histidine kinase [Cyclobacteriaceae bacterium]
MVNRKKLRLLIVLATLSILGISITQIYWVKQAFNLKEAQFNRDVNLALFNVAQQIFSINNTPSPSNNPTKQITTNYFQVMVNSEIDANLLEFLLKTEFEKRNILVDFEYGIYDCSHEKLIYGSYISMTGAPDKSTPSKLPIPPQQDYYFTVYFPSKNAQLIYSTDIWSFSTIVLFLVISFFAYMLIVILKQKRLSEVQRDFINNMTHEFKTPISTIALSAEVLKDPKTLQDPQRLINYVSIIETENLRMKNQVERVLQIASSDKEDIELKLEKTDIHQLLIAIIQNTKERTSLENITINYELKAKNHKLMADRLHLTNIIYNLLDNALKYCSKNPEIHIQTENQNGLLYLHITDNGIGIEQKEQQKIFNKFYRVSQGNRHDVKGFGLGLSYVKRMIEAHKGKITLRSNPGKGSTFTLIFKSHD